MKTKDFIKRLAIVLLVPALFLTACSDDKNQGDKNATVKSQTFTCPMHPQVVQDKMGTCPVCGMDLVPFEKNSAEAALHLDESQRALANITTMAVGLKGFNTYKQLNGRLVVNPEKTEYISSRVSGRLDRLYVRQTGEKISKGQPLYQIYSEQLASLQQEYLLALEQVAQFPGDKTFGQILKSSRQKLSLYGQSEGQIKAIKNSKKANPNITFMAPENGVVAELSVTEGQYVSEGSPLMRLEGYQSLWVEADIYPAEAGSIKEGQQVKVVIPGWEDQPQMVTIKFMNPALQTSSQVIQLRAAMPNPNNQWQPGLQANVFLPVESKGEVINLPLDAVIRDGKGAHVWIERAKDKFEPQIVETGGESFDTIEIKEGLKVGDQVVVSGAYLLYSEYILKKGKNPMSGVKI
ncbi:efflux RND transporter periplasmic adaptor subunit [Pedobacter immunditicola]|uniref:efflux RND transporter periplasmic adaptor subunit n=1 Tax=Pedobacter immunditicola TaxID=3133440 RepID=UPI00309B4466